MPFSYILFRLAIRLRQLAGPPDLHGRPELFLVVDTLIAEGVLEEGANLPADLRFRTLQPEVLNFVD